MTTRTMPLVPPIVAPSILSADFSRLAEALALPDPARDWVHCDVMDNHFVPNLTFGPLIVAAARRLTPAFLDVHLMIENPERLIGAFREAGADQITAHLEACRDPRSVIDAIHASGARAGLAIKPKTPLSAAEPFLAAIDNLLVMTVEPGFGGQSFMGDMMPKVAAAKAWRERSQARFLIAVDGGIAEATAREARAAGAEVFVAGHSIYDAPDPRAALDALRAAIR
ncbi:MAG TPA: ribulose-phosphate 3-epimerase [Candidatus Udaeobacter sp.]|jgi:ribulose-phosphate 3-epimerase|nr:ribulose-phosphate 3-epimerase [Candidatus Udaeobacter sp.]